MAKGRPCGTGCFCEDVNGKVVVLQRQVPMRRAWKLCKDVNGKVVVVKGRVPLKHGWQLYEVGGGDTTIIDVAAILASERRLAVKRRRRDKRGRFTAMPRVMLHYPNGDVVAYADFLTGLA